MVYKNNDRRALFTADEDKANYPVAYEMYDESASQRCPCCGAYDPDHFFMNDDEECVGCYECVHVVYDLF